LVGGANGKKWAQSFTRGYIEQAFRRVTVSEKLRRDQVFMMRIDHRRMNTGKSTFQPKKFSADSPACSICEAVEAACASRVPVAE
jgi:hypothetical protein